MGRRPAATGASAPAGGRFHRGCAPHFAAPALPTARGAAGTPYRDIKKTALASACRRPTARRAALRPETNAPRPVEKKKCSAGRSAPAQTSCRRRGKAGSPLRQSETESCCPWGDLWPGEVWDTFCADFRCRWLVAGGSFCDGPMRASAPTTAQAARSSCAAVGGSAAYGCGVPLAGKAERAER